MDALRSKPTARDTGARFSAAAPGWYRNDSVGIMVEILFSDHRIWQLYLTVLWDGGAIHE